MKNLFSISFYILIILFIVGCTDQFSKVYYVKEITRHYLQKNDYTQTTVRVWQKGQSGPVKQIFCAFDPDIGLKGLKGNNHDGWSGVKKIKVGKKYKEYPLGKDQYLCDVLEYSFSKTN